MKLCFMTLFLFLLLWLQLGLGNLSLAVPLALMGVAYFTVAYGWEYGGFGALLTGGALTVLYAGPGYLLLAAATVAATEWWFGRRAEEAGDWNWQLGMLLAAATAALAWGGRCSAAGAWTWNWYDSGFMVLQLIGSLILSGVACPLVVLAGEAAAEWLGLPRFRAGAER
ncbi:hypothetical protein SDC9_167330 [bioreactor metagenome]|uniref:Proton-coupled thiamine transporter YuaJ n=1 Tax=bioreactor metagenome TaxID=1076179 RepID=A0A645FZY4_9ZZZZ